MGDGLSFAKISEENIGSFTKGLSELHHVLKIKGHSPGYWKWRYLKGPLGRGNLIIALRGKRVVGKYGLLRLPLFIRGRLKRAGLMEGLLVDPSERFWQCYRGLVERYNLENRNDELSFSFGISNVRTLELHRRLGVIELGRIPVYLGFLDISKTMEGFGLPYPASLSGRLAQPFIGAHIHKSRCKYIDIQEVKEFDSSFDVLWDNISSKYPVSIVKDSRYLNWRYKQNPEKRYRCLAAYSRGCLEGLIVFCASGLRNGAYILELFARNDNIEVMKELLLGAFFALRAEGRGCITASFPDASAAAFALKSMRFKPWGTRIWSIHMIAYMRLRKSVFSGQGLRDWNFSIGDWLLD